MLVLITYDVNHKRQQEENVCVSCERVYQLWTESAEFSI